MPDRIQIRFGLEEKWEEMIGIPYSGQFFIAFPPKAQNHQNQAGLLACLVLPAFSDARWYIRLDPMARLAKSRSDSCMFRNGRLTVAGTAPVSHRIPF